MTDTTTTGKPLRVLGAVRQSKTKDKAISPEVQREKILDWAAKLGIPEDRVHFTFDLSTSGGKSPFDRKELGPYLIDADRIASWDILVVTRLDRACRSVLDYLNLAAWCDRHGKRLAVMDDPTLDTSTPSGKAMATMRAVFAELERELAKARNKERFDYLVDEGMWPGGRLNYGWRYDPDARRLEPDEGGTAGILREMADLAVAGKSHGQIADWLNCHAGPPWSPAWRTVIGRGWRPDTVRRVLRHSATQELLGEAKATQLRAALRSREQNRGERTNGHVLLRIAYCGDCGSPLYGNGRSDRPVGSYRCLPCGWYVSMAKLEAAVVAEVLKAAGGRELTGRVLVPGDDHQTQIHALERDIDQLERITGTELVVHAKQAEIEHLKGLPFAPDQYVRVPLGISVAAHWETLDAAGRGSFLREWQVTAKVTRDGRTPVVEVDLGGLAAEPGDFANETGLPEKDSAVPSVALPPPPLP